MLGDVAGFEYFKVPIADVPLGTGFDQFPGSPAVTERNTIVFKGNFAVRGAGKTGVFYRDIAANRGVRRSKSSRVRTRRFPVTVPGTAARSRSARRAAQRGGQDRGVCRLDDEGGPTAAASTGRSSASKPITLEKVVGVDDQVPGEVNQRFKTFGEAISLSSNGRSVLFWGTWGTETREVTLTCPAEGNVDLRTYCKQVTGNGLKVFVPVNQGFFVRDSSRHDGGRQDGCGSSISCTGTSRPAPGMRAEKPG